MAGAAAVAASTLIPLLAGAGAAPGADCGFAVSVAGVPWLVGGVGRAHVGGAWHSAAEWAPRPLSTALPHHSSARGGARPAAHWRRWAGTDHLGAFEAVTCGWVVGGVDVDTTVTAHNALNATVFDLSFPHGASGTNASAPPAEWAGPRGPSTDGVGPFAEFPAVDLGRGRVGKLSWMTWSNILQFHDTAAGTVGSGAGLYGQLNNLSGLSFGPMVLFDENATGAPGHLPTAVVSPVTNIPLGAAVVRRGHDDGCKWGKRPDEPNACVWAHGPSEELTSVPAGFSHKTVVVAGTGGVRDTLFKWGQFMQSYHNTTRLTDPTLEHLGVFTDNGAFYDAGYWPNSSGADASEVLEKLARSYSALNIPVHYIQLDDWWYVGGNRSVEHLVTCTASFTPKAVDTPAGPRPLFSRGLAPLKKQFGGGLMLYMVNFCPDNPYLSASDAARSTPDPNGNFFLSPLGSTSEAAYGRLMDVGLKQDMNVFEIDFMGQNFAFVPRYRTVAGEAEAWLSGMSRAAASRGLATQLCSDTPRDVMTSVTMPAVTQFRASMDFACSCDAEPWSGNWDIGGTGLLISSLGLGTSKDTFFTQGSQPGINHGQANNRCPVDNRHAELDLVVATLSGGPVGFGDGAGNTNRTLLMQCCDAGGRVLGPTVGLGSIDATWARGRRPPTVPKRAAGAVWTAHAAVGASLWHYVVAIDVPSSFQLVGTDLWPRRAPGAVVVHRGWHAAPCADGAAPAACGVVQGLPDAVTGLPNASSPVGTHRWELFTVSPVTHAGVALLGETGKVAAVSPRRFASVATTPRGGLRCELSGLPGETVRVSFLIGGASSASAAGTGLGGGATVRVVTATLSAQGAASVGVDPDGPVVLGGAP